MPIPWTKKLNKLLEESGFMGWVDSLVEENKDSIDDIEDYVSDIITQLIMGNQDSAYERFKNLKKPSAKLKGARMLISEARKDQIAFQEFKESVAQVLAFVGKTAVKSLL